MLGTVVFVHTVPPLIEVFDALARTRLPGMSLKHILDEPLLEAVRQRGRLVDEDSARLFAHLALAERIGARAALVTCSTISPLVDDVRPAIALPVLKIDEAMIAQAVTLGQRIGVIATNPTTLEPTRRLLEKQARTLGRSIQLEMQLVPAALAALLRGEGQVHDQAVAAAVQALSSQVEVIVLAQASMDRVLAALPAVERSVPILSSPRLALDQLRRILDDQPQPAAAA